MKLNVSGTTDGFTLKRSLLTSVSGSALEAMFSDRNIEMLERIDGYIYVDRDPEIFKYIISYLRNDKKLPEIKDSYIAELF